MSFRLNSTGPQSLKELLADNIWDIATVTP